MKGLRLVVAVAGLTAALGGLAGAFQANWDGATRPAEGDARAILKTAASQPMAEVQGRLMVETQPPVAPALRGSGQVTSSSYVDGSPSHILAYVGGNIRVTDGKVEGTASVGGNIWVESKFLEPYKFSGCGILKGPVKFKGQRRPSKMTVSIKACVSGKLQNIGDRPSTLFLVGQVDVSDQIMK